MASKLKGTLLAEYRLLQPENGWEPVWNLLFYWRGFEPITNFQGGAKADEAELIGKPIRMDETTK